MNCEPTRRRARAALATWAWACLAAACGPPAVEPPPQGAVLVVLDTLRADHLSSYGHWRETTPVLDALAERGVLFENAISNSSHTLPASAGLLAGRFPVLSVFDRTLQTSLVEALRDAGLRTAAFTEGGFFSRHFGFDAGFETFEEQEGPVHLKIRGERLHPEPEGGIRQTFAVARRWLADHAGERFFLLVHTYETHTPYRRRGFADDAPPGGLGETYEIEDVDRVRAGKVEIGPSEVAYLGALYDGGVREADRHVGDLLATLRELDLDRRTLVVVTSDHGEDLGDRFPRWAGDHGHALYDELVRVPLILHDPTREFATHRVSTQVRSLDVLPTILDLLGVPIPAEVEGRSLAPVMRGEETGHRPVLSHIARHGSRRARWALRVGTHKLILNSARMQPSRPPREVYDLEKDPSERENLAETRPELTRLLEQRFVEMQRALGGEDGARYDGAPLPESLHERLRSLGYVDD